MAKQRRRAQQLIGASSRTASDGIEIKVQIDGAKLGNWSLDDLIALEASQSIEATMNLLDTVVVGGVIGRGYKVKHLKAMTEALFAAIAEMGNPADALGKA